MCAKYQPGGTGGKHQFDPFRIKMAGIKSEEAKKLGDEIQQDLPQKPSKIMEEKRVPPARRMYVRAVDYKFGIMDCCICCMCCFFWSLFFVLMILLILFLIPTASRAWSEIKSRSVELDGHVRFRSVNLEVPRSGSVLNLILRHKPNVTHALGKDGMVNNTLTTNINVRLLRHKPNVTHALGKNGMVNNNLTTNINVRLLRHKPDVTHALGKNGMVNNNLTTDLLINSSVPINLPVMKTHRNISNQSEITNSRSDDDYVGKVNRSEVTIPKNDDLDVDRTNQFKIKTLKPDNPDGEKAYRPKMTTSKSDNLYKDATIQSEMRILKRKDVDGIRQSEVTILRSVNRSAVVI